MRVSFVAALVFVTCGVAGAQSVPPSGDAGSSVSVNLEALPIPLPRPKPTAEEMHPLALARPRQKPAFDAGAVVTPPDAVATAMTAAQPTTPTPAPTQPAPVQPAPPPAVPVTIVSSSAEEFPVEISGVAADPFAGSKNVNPLDGFAVLSRVRFVRGKSEIPTQAQPTLDTLVQRLLTSRERVRLAAFSGRAGDLSSSARRLSLARALAIRTYLASKGVSAERVDVLAFGGATDGVSDRVDVLVRGI